MAKTNCNIIANTQSFLELIKRLDNKGLKRREIAKILLIGEAPLSDYISGARPLGKNALYKTKIALTKENEVGLDKMIKYMMLFNHNFEYEFMTR